MSKAFYYISGPISGDPNYKIKFAIADYLIRKNYESEGLEIEIFNPAFEQPPDAILKPYSSFATWAHYLAFDLHHIVERLEHAQIEKIHIFRMVRLPKWQYSKGAFLESEFAKTTNRFSFVDELKGFSEALAALGLDEPNRQPAADHFAEFINIMDAAHVDHTNVPEAEQ